MYGLPERTRKDLPGARLVATPGCYVTAATLALAPLLDAGLIERDRDHRRQRRAASPGPAVSPRDERCSAPSTRTSRPTGCSIIATRPRSSRTSAAPTRRDGPVHAAPRADEPGDPRHVLLPAGRRRRRHDRVAARRLAAAYADEPFVVVTPASPSTKASLGSNTAFVTARYDERTGYVVALCAIDNLTKGASRRRAAGGQRRARTRRGGRAPEGRGDAVIELDPRPPTNGRRRSSRRCRTSGASPARPSSSSTAATRSPARPITTRSPCSPRTSC